MIKIHRNLPALLLAVLLAACLVAWYTTRDSAAPAVSSSSQALVDTSQLQRVVSMASFAATPEEQAQAREAWRLADHEVDLSFASAIRQAETDAQLPVAGPLRQMSERVTRYRERVAADKKRVAALDQDDSDALERAQAELTLDQDELDDAREDLARAGGDKRARLQRLLEEHQASDKLADRALVFPAAPAVDTLYDQVRAWLTLDSAVRQLQASAQAAAAHGDTLLGEHNTIESRLPAHAEAAASVAAMKALSSQRKTLMVLDQRIQDSSQLAAIYRRWLGQTEARRRAVLHLVLRSLGVILGILLLALSFSRVAGRTIHGLDRRRVHQKRIIARIAIQVVAAAFIAIVILGPPTQLSTIIGLATAGLTVVMGDFIVAFFGWFTLMGRNGISVGDWVEIEGVSGEVVEIGILKTVLLEMGNWTDTGQPTGRRVAFSNGFAIQRHFFNFSTSGQWLWDEIHVALPPGGDPHETVHRIAGIVERETRQDVAEAAQEWQRGTQHHGAGEFSAAPAVHLRPGPSGLEVVVRYITRAPNRQAVQASLFSSIVDVLPKAAGGAGGA